MPLTVWGERTVTDVTTPGLYTVTNVTNPRYPFRGWERSEGGSPTGI